MSLSIQDSLMQHLEKNYAIEGEIGRGGMGVVFRARDKRLERPVAIKVLQLAGHAGADIKQEVLERFQREARVVARLSHPNLVTVYDVGQEGGFYYMIQEFADGKALNDLISPQRGLPPALVTSIAHQICLALQTAHELNITHRDIKPANVILSPKGVAKLTDFGIAMLNQEDSTRLTQAGSVIGSIMYASPEQLQDASDVDARSDLYSLGVTMFELLTGRSPYQAEQISQLILEIMTHDSLPSLRALNPEIPEILELVVQRALKKNRQERYASAAEMATDLAQLLKLNAGQPQTFQLSFAETAGPATRNTSRDSVLLRRTSVNPQLIDRLRQNHRWVQHLIGDWQHQTLALQPIRTVLDKLLDQDLFGKTMSGCLNIDDRFLLLLCNGKFVGAAGLPDGFVGEAIFDALPEAAQKLELSLIDEQRQLIPLMIGNLLDDSGELIQTQLDSSLVDLVPMIDNFANSEDPFTGYVVCQAENNLYYYGYLQGQQVFCAAADPEAASGDSWRQLGSLAQEQGILMQVYRLQPQVYGPSQEKLLEGARLRLVYRDADKTTLQKLLDAGDDELPIHLIREAKENTHAELELQQTPSLELGEFRFDLSRQIAQSVPKRLGDWLLNEYFYLLNSSGNAVSLKYIYSWIPAIQAFSFAESLPGEDGQSYRFSLVARGVIPAEGYDKVLLLMRVGKGTATEVDRFLHDTIEVKKQLIKSGDIGGAIYVSTEAYETDALKLFYERTVEPRKKGFSLGALDKLTKYKGFVRIGLNRGFHLNLVEYHAGNQSFEVIAPLLK